MRVPRHKHCRPHQWSAADWAFPLARSGLAHSSFFSFPLWDVWQAMFVRIRACSCIAGVCMLSFGCLSGHKRAILRFEFWLCVLLPSSCTNAIWISTLHQENGMRNRAGWYTNRLQQRRISASVVWQSRTVWMDRQQSQTLLDYFNATERNKNRCAATDPKAFATVAKLSSQSEREVPFRFFIWQ